MAEEIRVENRKLLTRDPETTVLLASNTHRFMTILIAVAVLLWMANFVGDVVDALGKLEASHVDVGIAMVVAPIVGISTITVFLIIGAFRGYRASDLKNLPARTAFRAATGQETDP